MRYRRSCFAVILAPARRGRKLLRGLPLRPRARSRRFNSDVHAAPRLRLHRLPRRRRHADDPASVHEQGQRLHGQARAHRRPRALRPLPQRRHLMHSFKPQQRVDQLAQYHTSVHGKRLAAGDAAVANCVDCHSVHDIREVSDALSPVHPLRLPETCARCHADAGAHGEVQDRDQPVRRIPQQRALGRGGQARRPVRPQLRLLPRQPRRHAAAGRLRGRGLRHLPRGVGELYNQEPPPAGVRRDGPAAAASSATAITKSRSPPEAMLAGDGSVCAQCHEADSAGGKAAVADGRPAQPPRTELWTAPTRSSPGPQLRHGGLRGADAPARRPREPGQGPGGGARVPDSPPSKSLSRKAW